MLLLADLYDLLVSSGTGLGGEDSYCQVICLNCLRSKYKPQKSSYRHDTKIAANISLLLDEVRLRYPASQICTDV